MKKILTIVLLITLMPLSTAHAAKSSANQAMIEARTMIRAAEKNQNIAWAPVAIKEARDQYNIAQSEFDKRQWSKAEIAAKKSQRNAELADAKGRALQAEKNMRELKTVVDSLKQELNRQSGEL